MDEKKRMIAVGRLKGGKSVTLTYKDRDTEVEMQVTVPREALMEISVNCSDDVVVKFCEFVLARLMGAPSESAEDRRARIEAEDREQRRRSDAIAKLGGDR